MLFFNVRYSSQLELLNYTAEQKALYALTCILTFSKSAYHFLHQERPLNPEPAANFSNTTVRNVHQPTSLPVCMGSLGVLSSSEATSGESSRRS